jgi:cytochrome bd-type quinol oxidase subunit 1
MTRAALVLGWTVDVPSWISNELGLTVRTAEVVQAPCVLTMVLRSLAHLHAADRVMEITLGLSIFCVMIVAVMFVAVMFVAVMFVRHGSSSHLSDISAQTASVSRLRAEALNAFCRPMSASIKPSAQA